MKTFSSARWSLLAVILAGSCFLFTGCDEFKQFMPKTPPARKVQPLDPDIQKQLEQPDQAADADAVGRPHVTSEADRLTRQDYRGPSHDLAPDEGSGGHTLRKHVGRTDAELRDRLAHEDISASSTYTDRSAAQFAVGNALEENSNRIEQWLARSNHPNLVLDYRGNQPIGRTLHRGDSASRPCSNAKVVLRWLSSNEFYVLTSYPECR